MSAYQLQIAIYDTLTADAPLMALVQGVYDNQLQVSDPGDNSAFPFITIGDMSASPWDTDTDTGTDARFKVHIWSRASHSLECKQIADAVISVLHRGIISITGNAFIGCDYLTQTQEARDPDGVTRHLVLEFRIVYEEA
jgi:hypothetical protein